ncbi:hypothetical protein CC1G_12870 [Coprinopsis cinerea okayama7|uniref:Uncharacterized protein n=1 Tax=Coprinopsis cinerea (strain Okayama-7 / 130 / ATCC MYA-4618 / FGSC 9003) TaxID=240176 RepID=A8P8F4_COPC7|nr:hypothetical protein CC1G_12870 [Coprinopsis cinerea okayama7\|eukprot:XP_001839559.1 hypothetical protein CC1G_12870 [Coprinopsis cinerea okayama7\
MAEPAGRDTAPPTPVQHREASLGPKEVASESQTPSASHKNLTLHVPDDILQKIFIFYLLHPPFRSFTQPHAQRKHLICSGHQPLSPIDLALVCSAWKDLVDHTPQLWSRVNIQGRLLPQHLAALSTWLTNSRNHDLSFDLEFAEFHGRRTTHDEYTPNKDMEFSVLIGIMDELSKHSTRVKTFNVTLYGGLTNERAVYPPIFESLVAKGVEWSRLEEIGIKVDTWKPTGLPISGMVEEMLQRAPKLTSVIIPKLTPYGLEKFKTRYPFPEYPWYWLQEMTIHGITVPDLLTILPDLFELRVLKASISDGTDDDTPRSQIVHVPSLHSLFIYEYDIDSSRSSVALFRSISLRSLKNLSAVIKGSQRRLSTGEVYGSICECLERSQAKLESLTLGDHLTLGAANVEQTLIQFTSQPIIKNNLRKLTLLNRIVTRKFIDALTFSDPSAPVLLPKLEHLILSRWSVGSPTARGILMNMAITRSQVAPLKTLKVIFGEVAAVVPDAERLKYHESRLENLEVFFEHDSSVMDLGAYRASLWLQ